MPSDACLIKCLPNNISCRSVHYPQFVIYAHDKNLAISRICKWARCIPMTSSITKDNSREERFSPSHQMFYCPHSLWSILFHTTMEIISKVWSCRFVMLQSSQVSYMQSGWRSVHFPRICLCSHCLTGDSVEKSVFIAPILLTHSRICTVQFLLHTVAY
jgi:hypothetical protein